jgi:modification methylase
MADAHSTPLAADPAHEHPAWRCRVGDERWVPGLSVWPVAQRSPAAQRRGRYVAGSSAHPARMLPDLAAHAITAYTHPGELVADPLAGVGTTLIEAVHAGRHAVGVEYEPGWAALAAANIAHAHAQGGTGHAEVIQADATGLPDILPDCYRGQVALVLTSPPYGRTMHGRVEHRRGPLTRFHNSYGPPDPVNLAHRSRIGLLDGLTRVLAGCLPLLRPDGLIVVTARPWRRNGLLVDLPGQIIDAATAAGLHPVDRCVALLAAVHDDGHLQPRHSFWQLTVTRQARRNGIPLSLLVHEDALVFAAAEPRAGSGALADSSHHDHAAASPGVSDAGRPGPG